ncbi:MAG: sn-glycerol-3-phosphate ABC transporter ATP-binding protein UgpC [bacterium]|nr:sn-glycerol-3-phosphate ABC transporter ATP-binding protein UgpC [bacterium]
MAKVVLQNLWKTFDKDVVAVRDVNLEINDREFMVLVGPSGCGKSTTLRMVAGLEEITRGEIYIGDRLVNDVLPKDRDIAMVFQNYALYPHMTVYDNMAFGLKLRKYSKTEIKERVESAADILGITEYLGRKPKALSGGQRQRVAVGRAIVRQPSVFLFDEPLSNLDAKLRVQMRTEISRLHNRIQATMIYVTHDQTEAMTMGDRITVMKDGVIHQVDTPLNLYNKPSNLFVGGFIGSPAMNFIAGRLADNAGLVFESEMGPLPLGAEDAGHLKPHEGKEVFMGIRPEDIHSVEFGPDIPSISKIDSEVDVIEPMGNELFLYVKVAGASLVARIDPRQKAVVGGALPLCIDMDKVIFFDAKTEEHLV